MSIADIHFLARHAAAPMQVEVVERVAIRWSIAEH
jgi:hypothetical protein